MPVKKKKKTRRGRALCTTKTTLRNWRQDKENNRHLNR